MRDAKLFFYLKSSLLPFCIQSTRQDTSIQLRGVCCVCTAVVSKEPSIDNWSTTKVCEIKKSFRFRLSFFSKVLLS